MSDARRLAIYLNDHLAGATLGRDLARRAAGNNRDDERFGPFLARLAQDIDADRDALLGIMGDLGVSEDRVKQLSAWTGEKLGRLKLNGSVLSYSPLSRLIELEGLNVGIAGKLALWLALQRVAHAHGVLARTDLKRLVERAESQLAEVHERRLAAAELALAGG